jgi:Tol biopolymer transport system component
VIATRVDAPWRRRFLAPTLTFPIWARDRATRLLYTSNASGKREVYAWDQETGRQRQVTDRPEGTIMASLDPGGSKIWWFDDDHGSEFGGWRVEDFSDSSRSGEELPLPPAYPAGLALGRELAVVGRANPEGVQVHLLREGLEARELYRHGDDAAVAGLSRD